MKKEMGIGTVYLMIASLVGIFSGYIIHIGLGRYLGPALYGIFGVLMSLFQMNRSFFQAGFPKAAAKYVAESDDNVSGVLHSSMQLQLFGAVFFATVYIFFSRVIASFLHDRSLYGYIILLGIMTIPLSLQLFYFEGYLNGLRMFKEEAKGKMILTVLRVFFIFLFVALGLEVLGALLGYLFSILTALGLGILLWRVDRWKRKTHFSKKKLVLFALPLLISSFAMVILRTIDLLFVKSLMQNNAITGFYTAASTLAGVPYLIFSALSLTLLPSVSQALGDGDVVLVRSYIHRSLRYLFLALLPVIAIATATATHLLIFFYSSVYEPGGGALFILLFSSMFLVIFLTLIAIIVGSGKPWISMWICVLGAVILAILAYVLVPIFGMHGAAVASLCASVVTVVLSGLYVFFRYNVFVCFFSVVRIIICAGIIFALGYWWNPGGMMLVFAYPLLLLLYVALLYILREFTPEDVAFVKHVRERIFTVK